MSRIYLRFPGGVERAVTLSYDDGVESDRRLMEILDRHGMKATFNLNSGSFAPEGTVYPAGTIHRRMSLSDSLAAYRDCGHEVALHASHHPFLEQLPANVCTREILDDRMELERLFGRIVRGMAYPFGTTSDGVVESLRACGIAYARTTVSTGRFDIPTDWLRMSATCHHEDPRLMELAQAFLRPSPPDRPARLFYLWGHSYEFDGNDNWNRIEEFCETIGGRRDIWYATNIQIHDYVEAWQRLRFSTDGRIAENPTATDLYVDWNESVRCVKAGCTEKE